MTAMEANRIDRQHLILTVSAGGVLVGIAAYITTRLLLAIEPDSPTSLFNIIPIFSEYWKEHFPQQYSGTVFLAFLIGIAPGLLLRLLTKVPLIGDKYLTKTLDRWVDAHGSEIEKLFRDSMRDSKLVQVTLKSNKVYIGEAKFLPAERPSSGTHLKIALHASGYRDGNNLTVHITSRYHEQKSKLRGKLLVLEELIKRNSKFKKRIAIKYLKIWDTINSMHVILPFDEIVVAMPFNEDIFNIFAGEDHCKANKTVDHSSE